MQRGHQSRAGSFQEVLAAGAHSGHTHTLTAGTLTRASVPGSSCPGVASQGAARAYQSCRGSLKGLALSLSEGGGQRNVVSSHGAEGLRISSSEEK